MNDRAQTKEQLISQLAELRHRISELEASEAELKRAEEALLESQGTARALLNAPTDVVALMDTRGFILDANEAMARRFGRHVDELIGLYGWALLPPDLAERRKAHAGQVIQSGKPVRFEDEHQGICFDNAFYPCFDAQGKVVKVAVLARDITERKQAEEALRESQERYRDLFESMMDGLVVHRLIVDEKGKPVDYILEKVNSAAEKILSWKREDIEGKRATEVYSGDTPFIERYAKVAQSGKAEYFIDYYPRFGRWYEITSFCPQKGHFANVFRDITERKQWEEALKESEERYRSLFDNSIEGVFTVDIDGNYTSSNKAYAELFGYTIEELIGASYKEVVAPENAQSVFKEYNKLFRTGEPIRNLVYQAITKSGEGRLLEGYVNVIRERDRIVGFQGTSRDITERKRAEEKIKASLKEKEVLLQEIHHRVKNNLQVISSLLRLQSGQMKDERYADMLKESQNRVRTMALIHEKLYQAEDLARIDFGGYIKSLARGLSSAYRAEAGKVTLRTEIEDIRLGVNYAMPCGLIINELVSNSLKHAFPKGKKGAIKVAMRLIGENEVELVVSDNGIGMPESLDFRNAESLGLQLVSMLAEDQLGGQIELDRTEGTKVQIKFSVAE